jgi:hypothetical protein
VQAVFSKVRERKKDEKKKLLGSLLSLSFADTRLLFLFSALLHHCTTSRAMYFYFIASAESGRLTGTKIL